MAAIDTGKISSFFSSFASKIKSVVEEEKEYVKTFLSEDKPKEDPKPKVHLLLVALTWQGQFRTPLVGFAK